MLTTGREVPITAVPDMSLWDTEIGRRMANTFQMFVPFGFAQGGITSYARGGIEAHITGRELIRYGEPSTGAKPWIPRLSPTPRRSEEIARIAARWLGGMFLSSDELAKATLLARGGSGCQIQR